MLEHDNDDVEGFQPDRRSRARRVRLLAGIVAAAGLLVLGAIGGAALNERRQTERRSIPAATPTPAADAASPATGHGAHAPGATVAPSSEPIEVTLTPEALQRAGITIVTATAIATPGALTVPATVASNAYRDTKVNALVGGIIRQVRPELGATIRQGEPLAIVFSNELAEAQMKYLSTQAMLVADEQKFERTRKLVDLGAASRQELDDATAARAARAMEVAAARQRLLLLGLDAEQVRRLTDSTQIVSEVTIPAPADGIVIARSANPGQVIAAGQELFVVTDLGTVWVMADLYEKDFGAVRVGTPASVRVPAALSRPISGRVAYLEPRVDPATRTAKVRVEVQNRDGALKLGMFVEVTFTTGAAVQRPVVPRAAVQSIGGRSVVYVATDDEGRFVERQIRLGAVVGDAVEVVDGLKPGERVVGDGSFYLRAEAGRARGGG